MIGAWNICSELVSLEKFKGSEVSLSWPGRASCLGKWTSEVG